MMVERILTPFDPVIPRGQHGVGHDEAGLGRGAHSTTHLTGHQPSEPSTCTEFSNETQSWQLGSMLCNVVCMMYTMAGRRSWHTGTGVLQH